MVVPNSITIIALYYDFFKNISGRLRIIDMNKDKNGTGNIVSEYSHAIKYDYKIFKENLSLAFTKQIFCLVCKRFCLLTP